VVRAFISAGSSIFLEAASRPKAPLITIFDHLQLPIIVEEFQTPDPDPHKKISDLDPANTAMGKLLIRNPLGRPKNLDLKFVRIDGKDLTMDHVMAFRSFIIDSIIPAISGEDKLFVDNVGEALVEVATRANFEKFWEHWKSNHCDSISPYDM
jgi:hypothetical protein